MILWPLIYLAAAIQLLFAKVDRGSGIIVIGYILVAGLLLYEAYALITPLITHDAVSHGFWRAWQTDPAWIGWALRLAAFVGLCWLPWHLCWEDTTQWNKYLIFEVSGVTMLFGSLYLLARLFWLR